MKNRNIALSTIIAGSLLMACNQKPVVDEAALSKMVEEKVMAAIDAKQSELNAKIEAAAQLKADSIIAAMPKAKTAVKAPAKPVAKPKPAPKPAPAPAPAKPKTPTTNDGRIDIDAKVDVKYDAKNDNRKNDGKTPTDKEGRIKID